MNNDKNEKMEVKKLYKPVKNGAADKSRVVLYGMEGGSNSSNCNCVAGC